MCNLIKANLFRMGKSAGVRIAFLVTVLAAALYYVAAHMVSMGDIAPEQAGTVSGLADPMILSLFGALFVGLLIGSDFENKTVHGAIGMGRTKILCGYLSVYIIGIFLLTIPYIVGSVVCIAAETDMAGAGGAAVSTGLINVMCSAGDISIGKLIVSYLAMAVVYMGQISVCIPVAVKVKKPIVVTAFGFFFGMVTAFLATVVSKVEMLEQIYELTPFAYSAGSIAVCASYGDLLKGIIVSILFTGLMGILSWAIFRRTEIK